ncbi:hypothetical protein BC832DRAFT_517822, partial [Gaertneriomyces semiglobifer]
PAWRTDLDHLRKSNPVFPTKAAVAVAAISASPAKPINGHVTPQVVCHGRVTDLEEMVPSQWWKHVFADEMYLRTDGDMVEDPEITKEEVGLLEQDEEVMKIFLRGTDHGPQGQPARILDLCCGQGRHILHLAQKYPHISFHGHDQSSFLIQLAQHRSAAQHATNNTVFTVGDCRSIPYLENSFDLVMVMGNSFGYFSDEDGDKIVLKEIMRVLAPGGRVILDLTDGEYMRDYYAERSWEWIDDATFVCRERQLSKDGKRLVSREVVSSTTKGVVRDQFYQERLYSKSEVEALVKSIGFSVLPGKKQTDIVALGDLSKRKEDLGMMEQRLLLTAMKPLLYENGVSTGAKKVNGLQTYTNGIAHRLPNGHSAGVSRKVSAETDFKWNADAAPPSFPHVTVLLGDPSQRCIGKLNDNWNPEDFETRDKLLQALRDLGFPSSAISVLDKHDNYLRELSERHSTFVFNLCDEGYNNDALQELHVPALLDMLDLPYSGAGPNCLAYCYDKGLVNRTAAAIGVATPKETFYFADSAPEKETLHATISSDIGYPAFIKPVKGDNSLGITTRSIVHNEEELDTYMDELRSLGIKDVIVQEYLQGSEYGVGMVGNKEMGFHFFPVLEVDYSQITSQNLPPILGYESKWDPTSPYWTDISYKSASLPESTIKQLQQWCVMLNERFGCRDYARFDFRADAEGNIKLLEVNPNPGWCWDGKMAYMGKLEGLDYKDVIGMILKAACDRLR